MKVQTNDLIYKVQNKIDNLTNVVQEKLVPNFQRPGIMFFWNNSSVAGYVIKYSNQIYLNYNFLYYMKDEFINETPGHELAHLVSWCIFGYKIEDHGREWEQVMNSLGLEPKVNFCIDSSSKLGYIYSCGCYRHVVSAIKHNKIQVHKKIYVCSSCEEVLTYTGQKRSKQKINCDVVY